MNFDRNILIDNIQRLRHENNNMSQSNLGKIADMEQSRVSPCLNKNAKACFSIEQLIAIANAFNTSLDSLLGISPPKAQTVKANTVAQVLEHLFAIRELVDIKFETVTIEAGGEFRFKPIEEEVFTSMYFDWHIHDDGNSLEDVFYINECIKKWSEIIKTCSDGVAGELIPLWEKEILKSSSQVELCWKDTYCYRTADGSIASKDEVIIPFD